MYKILFLGTASNSAYVLKHLINKYQIIGCITQPDRLKNRHHEIIYPEVKQIALEHNIPVYQPENIKKDFQIVLDLEYDFLICVSYGQILPKVILNHAKYKSLNIHYSLLPLYRGSSPVQSAIANNEAFSGVSIMEISPKMDCGNVFAMQKIAIDINDTTTTLFAKLNQASLPLLDQVMDDIVNKNIKGKIQDDLLATYTSYITKADEHIDFNANVLDVYNKIRSLLDEPGCYFQTNGKKYKITKCSFDHNSSIIGKITNINKSELLLGCIDGNIKILALTPAGKKNMDIKSFLNGNHGLEIGMDLE